MEIMLDRSNFILDSGKTPGPHPRRSIQNREPRSEQAQELLSARPGFIQQWALLCFLIIFALITVGAWVIKYPDTIQARSTLTAANAPKELMVRQEGTLVRLFAKNDQHVVAGQVLGWIESTADHQQVLQLGAILSSAGKLLDSNRFSEVSRLFSEQFASLGELQPTYQQFIGAWQQFNDYLINGYYYRKKTSLAKDYELLLKRHAALLQSIQLAQQDLELTTEASSAIDSLYIQKVLSQQDRRDQQSKLLGKKMYLPQLSSSLLDNEQAQTDKQQEINDLEHSISQQKVIFSQTLQTLKSALDDWTRKYIISAPVDGKVVFIVPLQENQFLQTGKLIGYLNPPDSRFYAQVTLPQSNFGKMSVGETVQLRFDAYPYQEFGYVEGKLSYISRIPSDSGFLATIALPAGLVTNYRNQIQYRSGLASQALIITKDARLIQRLFYSLVKTTQP